MQVSVEELGALERRMTVQVPASEVDQEVQSRLSSLARRVRVHGFRPGKVPFKVVQRMYGDQVRQEVVGEVLQRSFAQAVDAQKLRPAGGPRIEPKSIEAGADLEYSAVFEVLPEFELKGLDGLPVERPAAEVTEADVDQMLETLRKQRTDWVDVERPAQKDDRVTLDFEGTLDGQEFPGNKGEDVTIVLGSGRMVPGFEDALIGAGSGAELAFDLTFPDDYHAAELAGKQVHFSGRVKAVAEPHLPEIDDKLAESFGIAEGGVDGLRKALRENMERELGQGIKATVKRQVMEALLQANPIDLPQAMVVAELDRLAAQAQFPESDDPSAATRKREIFEGEARRRVALGLIISRLVRDHEIKADPDRIQAQLENIAASYEDPGEVIAWYRQNAKAMEDVDAAALEEGVVDWLLARATVSDKPQSFDEVMKPNRS